MASQLIEVSLTFDIDTFTSSTLPTKSAGRLMFTTQYEVKKKRSGIKKRV
jgi:hypothetical protein